MSLDPNHELDASTLTVDTRSVAQRFFAALYRPGTFRNVLLLFIGVQIYLPALWPVWVITILVMVMSFQDQKFVMPLRMPKDIGGLDRTDYFEELIETNRLWGLMRNSRTVRKYLAAAGILYLGFMRARSLDHQGRELWLNNSDARTHMFLAGTTGSGKSEALMGIFHNAICWGSGACYGDGKADSNLGFCLWSLARRHGREDDFLVLNYLTGGSDPFERMVSEEVGRFSGQVRLAQSNSMNPFGDGAADFLLQLMASLLPRASGDGAQWQGKALNMMDAELRTLCYMRAKGEVDISIGVIRHYLALQNLVKFYIAGQEGKLPELAFLPIKAYFETGLPGFNPAQANDPSKWDPEVFNQHGYLTGQFARTLAMMMDTYGFIFADKYPDIDMLDVLLNDRLLVVMIPSLEKSAPEAAALGKLYISSIRLMMAQNLGYRLEGTKAEVLDAKATNAPNPSVIISDELAYYFAEGIAVMFAQARSLGFMMIAAVQDVQGLKRGEAGEEWASMFANTKVKWTLALEDTEDTYELFKKAAGDGYYSVLSGHDASVSTFATTNTAQKHSSIERREKINGQALKKLNSGQGVVIFKDAAVPSASYYIDDRDKKTSKLRARINRFLQVERPQIHRMPKTAKKITTADPSAANAIFAQLRRNQRPLYPSLDDPILSAVTAAASSMNDIHRFEVTPVERGIVLFEAARRALKLAAAAGRKGYMHEARQEEPTELVAGADDDDIPESAFDD
ncbi:TraG-D_C domain-containing protein [Burkholderia diffusa]|uniref:TraM recognition domain-containing protein n=1 Tax=Burkholderia diffusa TaxID=488732 RepID=UPI001CAFFF21|nr:TraM recognition domain-containing protein [Burkholderia diffusa]CAG9260962.1 TraG-D_C domain-containing protein [Burkholderia diffusa]